MKNLLVALAITSVALVGLTACGNDPAHPNTNGDSTNGYFSVTDVNVHDRMVPCVTWKLYNAGGLSCDWNAK